MSTELLKYALALSGLSLLGFHLFATVSHLAPAHPLRHRLEPVTRAYIDPLLRQQWDMFAPDPATSSFKLHFRYEGGKEEQEEAHGWSDWLDAGEPLLRAHQRNRLTHWGHLYWVHEGIGHQLWNRAVALEEALPDTLGERERARHLNEQIVQTDVYRLAARYFTDLARREAAASAEETGAAVALRRVQFRALDCPVVPFSRRPGAADGAFPLRPTIRTFPPVRVSSGLTEEVNP